MRKRPAPPTTQTCSLSPNYSLFSSPESTKDTSFFDYLDDAPSLNKRRKSTVERGSTSFHRPLSASSLRTPVRVYGKKGPRAKIRTPQSAAGNPFQRRKGELVFSGQRRPIEEEIFATDDQALSPVIPLLMTPQQRQVASSKVKTGRPERRAVWTGPLHSTQRSQYDFDELAEIGIELCVSPESPLSGTTPSPGQRWQIQLTKPSRKKLLSDNKENINLIEEALRNLTESQRRHRSRSPLTPQNVCSFRRGSGAGVSSLKAPTRPARSPMKADCAPSKYFFSTGSAVPTSLFYSQVCLQEIDPKLFNGRRGIDLKELFSLSGVSCRNPPNGTRKEATSVRTKSPTCASRFLLVSLDSGALIEQGGLLTLLSNSVYSYTAAPKQLTHTRVG